MLAVIRYKATPKTKRNMKLLKNIFLISIVLFFNSCTIPTHFFIQNLTQKNCELIIMYNTPINKLPQSGSYDIKWLNGIVTPKVFNKSIETTEIEFTQINDSTLIFIIPKESTIRVTQSSNMYFTKYIKQIGINESIFSIDDLVTQSHRKNGMFTYQIKN